MPFLMNIEYVQISNFILYKLTQNKAKNFIRRTWQSCMKYHNTKHNKTQMHKQQNISCSLKYSYHSHQKHSVLAKRKLIWQGPIGRRQPNNTTRVSRNFLFVRD